jgi:excisionase family DNA binding protein
MSLGITWYTVEEAASKYSLDKSLILKWVDEGIVRSEQAGEELLRVNMDDLELKLQETTGR